MNAPSSPPVARMIAALNAGDRDAFLQEFGEDCSVVEPQQTYTGKSAVSGWFEHAIVESSATIRVLTSLAAEPDHYLMWAEWAVTSFFDGVTVWTPLAVSTDEAGIREIHISPPLRVPTGPLTLGMSA